MGSESPQRRPGISSGRSARGSDWGAGCSIRKEKSRPLVLPYGPSEPPVPNSQEEEGAPGTFSEPPPAPCPALTTPEPRLIPRRVTRRAPGPPTPNAPAREGMRGPVSGPRRRRPCRPRPPVRHGQVGRRKLFHPPTLGGHTPAASVASLDPLQTALPKRNRPIWEPGGAPRRTHFRPDVLRPAGRLSRAPRRRPGRRARHGLTPPRRPPASPLPPAGALEAGRWAGRRRGRGGAGRRDGPAGRGHAPSLPVQASRGVAGAVGSWLTQLLHRSENLVKKRCWFRLWGYNTEARRKEAHKRFLGLLLCFK